MRLPDPRERPFLTPEEAWPFTTLSRGLFYAGLRNDEVPCRRVGRRFIIPTAAFYTWAGLDWSPNGDASGDQPKAIVREGEVDLDELRRKLGLSNDATEEQVTAEIRRLALQGGDGA